MEGHRCEFCPGPNRGRSSTTPWSPQIPCVPVGLECRDRTASMPQRLRVQETYTAKACASVAQHLFEWVRTSGSVVKPAGIAPVRNANSKGTRYGYHTISKFRMTNRVSQQNAYSLQLPPKRLVENRRHKGVNLCGSFRLYPTHPRPNRLSLD